MATNNTTSQMHGKNFENFIKSASGIFSHATPDRQRSPNDRFDIGKNDDIKLGLPTSIKSTGNNIISLSDARAFWQSFNYTPYRIIIGCYIQKDKIKIFNKIYELILTKQHRPTLLGKISLAEISDFHNKLATFKKGTHEKARTFAKQRKKELETKRGLVMLNQKIDSKTQRRLQCSVALDKLLETISDFQTHRENFGKLGLPLKIISKTRKFK